MKLRFFLIFFVFLNGCTAFLHRPSPEPDRDREIRSLLGSLVARNDSIQTFKGIGSIRVQQGDSRYRARLAWVGAVPGKLRVELIGTPGQPKTGFASDGEWISYFDPKDPRGPIKRIQSKNADLKDFISVPVTAEEVVALLSGRTPTFPYHSVELEKNAVHGNYTVTLYRRWRWGKQVICCLDPVGADITTIETYKGDRLAYRAEFRKMQTVEGYRVPMQLILSNAEGGSFELNVERYWVNPSVSANLFVLEPPKPNVPNSQPPTTN